MNTIFEVSVVYSCREKRESHFPSYPIWGDQIMVATSVEAAEQYIRTRPRGKNALKYSIKEIRLNVGKYRCICLTERIYDWKGELIDKRMYSKDTEEKNSKFYGRKQSEIRFSIGDIVEVLHGDEAFLAMIIGLPLTEEEAQEKYKKAAADGYDDYALDWTDDTYAILSYGKKLSGTGNADPLDLIMPSFKISEYRKDYFKGLYYEFECYINGDEYEEVIMKISDTDKRKWINDVRPAIFEDTVKNYGHRTWANAEWSDITLAFAADFKSPGEITTKKAAGDKFIGYHLTSEEVMREQDDCFWKAQGRKYADKIRSNPNYREEGIKLNIAGNSMISLSRYGIDADSVQDAIYQVLKNLLSDGIVISEVRSGGQSGADEFGIIAAQRLGLKCSILAPKGYRFHYKEGEEIEGYSRFVKRFQKQQ